MILFVDTSVWSAAFRRDAPQLLPEVRLLAHAIEGGQPIVATGLVLQELLQGFAGPRAHVDILLRFAVVPLLPPSRDDHVRAASLRNHCRRNGVQIGTVDALLAQLCIQNGLTLLTLDNDFRHVARFSPLKVWDSI